MLRVRQNSQRDLSSFFCQKELIPRRTTRLQGLEMYPCGFLRAKPATGGSQYDSHRLVQYAELGEKENLKMACKDDRIWTKSLLFIYAQICVNVKRHLNHALFMVWLFLWGKKKKEEARWLDVLLILYLVAADEWVVWQAWTMEQAVAHARPGVGTRSLTLLAWSDLGTSEKALLVIECS